MIFCVFIGSIIYVVLPLFDQELEPLKNVNDLDSLQIRKRIIYRDIKELEMDFELGKIDDTDFKNTRSELKQEVAGVIAELKKLTNS